MLFTDPLFLFYFLPVALLIHAWAVRGLKGREYDRRASIVVFTLTLLFYGAKEPWWIAPFLAAIVFDFLWATLLQRTENARLRLFIVSFSVVQNLGLLAVFKYWNLFASTIEAGIPDAVLPRLTQGDSGLLLPAGISFYTFESMSFVIDVYRRHIRPPKSPLEFFAFIAMFPRFIAGPIVRYADLQSQLNRYPGMQVETGFGIFIKGLVLKCCFADSFAVFVPYAFRDIAPGFIAAWIGVTAYTMQIYFDFAGYSLMAIGLGKCLGFDFPQNFDRPYLATSLRDFWRRWHITLSTWLRDYLYISLGGDRKGRVRTSVNVFLTMLLGGLWHGASWTFVVWGAWHGGCLILERQLRLSTVGAWAHVRTLLVVVVGWVFFRADSIKQAGLILHALFNPWSSSNAGSFNPYGLWNHGFSLALALLGLGYAFVWKEKRLAFNNSGVPLGPALTRFVLFLVAIAVAWSSFEIPFLYFQF